MGNSKDNAVLALEDGSLFWGTKIGRCGIATGELVFNTSMTGYQEVLTDPSYAGQIVTFTYPHIGNVGINAEDMESDRAWVSGVVIKELSHTPSNWRSSESLEEFLKRFNVIGIANVDTRHITRVLRDCGTLKCCIMTKDINVENAVTLAKQAQSLNGVNMMLAVSTQKAYSWKEERNSLIKEEKTTTYPYYIVVYDFGVKYSILRSLADYGCHITVVPATTAASKVLSLCPDGIILSNGPGDPSACFEAVKHIQSLLNHGTPILGICLGHQLLALALGGEIERMKFGHHGTNHPIFNLANQKVMISSQNHSFAVKRNNLPPELQETQYSLFDGSIQGIKRVDPETAIGFQGHPEAGPGPLDMSYIFQDFFSIIQKNLLNNSKNFRLKQHATG